MQRQRYLLHNNPNITRAQAYDIARKEFYDLRLQEDVERRVAKEEAMSTGAYFGPSPLEIGMELENKEFERWKDWAQKEVTFLQQQNAAMYTGAGVAENEDTAVEADVAELEVPIEDVADQLPDQGQSGLGDATITR